MTTNSPPTATPRSKGLVIALVVAVVMAGVAVTVLAMVLLARGPLPTSGADMSPTATTTGDQPTLEPSPSAPAEATAKPTPAPLAPDTLALVTVNELNLREGPTSTAKSLGHLSAGDRVFVVQGPEQADGFGWYQVARLDDCSPECLPGLVGWVAGLSDTQDMWLTPGQVHCLPDPDLHALVAISAWERLACYGHQALTLKGVIWSPCCGYVGPYIFEPEWLAYPTAPAYLGDIAFPLRFDPADGLKRPEFADIVRVTGHFDDGAAATCTTEVDDEMLDLNPSIPLPDPPEVAFPPMNCRTQFVVDAIKIEGNTGEKCQC